ncbi:MAG: protein kinase [Moorea sp. SIO2I5]|nr:protein kinase [Moorena sp. SIO2I5]
MTNKVTLTITDGGRPFKTLTFEERSTCLIGRETDCNLKLPNDRAHQTISRYHCLLDINPPYVNIRDFGSLNGTDLNGKIIGQRKPGQSAKEGKKEEYPTYDLQTGDKITLGKSDVVLQVEIEKAPEVSQTIPVIQVPKSDPSTPANDNEQSQYLKLLQAIIRQPAGHAIKDYDIGKMLGKGGFGEVYLARHQQTGEQVAIKLMLPDVATNKDNVERFLDEAAKTKALHHPNVVQLKDFGNSDGVFFFTLEYCEGGSVDKLMKDHGGRLSIKQAMPIIFQTLDGLHYAHNASILLKNCDGTLKKVKGLVHRDVSPQNIFLAKSGNTYIAKVGDYGLAKAFEASGMSSRTLTGTVAGKPVYMPRQQVANFKRAKPEVDVWAVAASLYVMLTGTPPRNFPQGQDPFLALLHSEPVPIRQRNRAIPKALAEVIDLALKDKSELHFKDAISFKQALEAAL